MHPLAPHAFLDMLPYIFTCIFIYQLLIFVKMHFKEWIKELSLYCFLTGSCWWVRH